MEWLHLRLARMELNDRLDRERRSTRRLRADVTEQNGDVTAEDGDVIHDNGDVPQDDDVTRDNSDVTSENDVAPYNGVTAGEDDAVHDGEIDGDIISTSGSRVVRRGRTSAAGPAASPCSDVTQQAGDVPPSGGEESSEESVSSEEGKWATEDAGRLRQRLQQQRRQLRGLKRRLAQLERENAALRMRRDPDPAPAEPADPAALVEDIKQAAAETAAQLQPSGLVYQPESGLYYDHDSGYYWDPARHMYYDGSSGYYLSYDEASGAYVYVPPVDGDHAASALGDASADRSADPWADPSADSPAEPAAAGGVGRRRRSEDELEDGEIEEDEEKEDCVARQAAARAVVDYWSPERIRQARPQTPPDYSGYSVQSEPGPAVFQSGPRSPQTCQEPPWLRMIVTETKVEGLRLGSLHVATMDGLTVGRDASQQLCLNDVGLSKFHAVIGYRPEPSDFYVRDLGSRNGTFVDGRRVSAAKQESVDTALPHGCQLRLGSTCLVCHVHAANETCLECEPGHTQQPPATEPTVPAPAADTRQQRRQVADRIKQKYGLRPGHGAAVGAGRSYTDRAAERRLAIGSDHPSEKTQMADVSQAIPAKNRGFQLLSQMGWKQGAGLGRAEQGIVEPINVEERGERRGLGCKGPVMPSVGQAEKRRTEVWQKTQERFRKLV